MFQNIYRHSGANPLHRSSPKKQKAVYNCARSEPCLISLTTKALGKAERMCKRLQSHCLRQQRLVYIRLFQPMSTGLHKFLLVKEKSTYCRFHINTVNIKKAPRVSSGLKTKESGNCKEADAILQLILRKTQSRPHLHRPDQLPSYPARAS